jgi:hypothetical protein
MNPYLALDWVILPVVVLSAWLMYKIWHKVGGKGRLVLMLAFIYQSCIRVFTLYNELHPKLTQVPTPQLSLIFYLLVAGGFAMLLFEIKHTMNGK